MLNEVLIKLVSFKEINQEGVLFVSFLNTVITHSGGLKNGLYLQNLSTDDPLMMFHLMRCAWKCGFVAMSFPVHKSINYKLQLLNKMPFSRKTDLFEPCFSQHDWRIEGMWQRFRKMLHFYEVLVHNIMFQAKKVKTKTLTLTKL